jgi:aspartate-semialdehyde dehydrogenase
VDNVIPWIEGEEEKIEVETGKILGRVEGERILPAPLGVAAHCHRVATLDGHLEAVSVELAGKLGAEEAAGLLASYRGEVAELGLPSAPTRPILVRPERDRPQPRLDRSTGDGMAVVVGRIRPCPVLSLRLEILSHNTVRGAAGGTVLNAELLVARGLVRRRSGR